MQLFLGTLERSIYIYNAESRNFTHEFQTDTDFPKITALACSPVDPLIISSSQSAGKQTSGSLLAWNLRSMKADVRYLCL